MKNDVRGLILAADNPMRNPSVSSQSGMSAIRRNVSSEGSPNLAISIPAPVKIPNTVPRPAVLTGAKSAMQSSKSAPSPAVAVVPHAPNSSRVCSQTDLSRRSQMTVLTTTNAAFLDITENMLESIKRTGTCPIVTVITEDEASFQKLTQRTQSQPGLRVQRTDAGATTSQKLRFNTGPYNRFVARRPRYVLNCLQNGLAVLFVDADTFWFKDPFKDFEGDFDIAAHNEFSSPRCGYCDGFTYYKPTANTLSLVNQWVRQIDAHHGNKLDQNILNQLLCSKAVPNLKIKTFDPVHYPDGKKYFLTPGWRQRNNQTVVLHMTYIMGHDAKVQKLKEFGWWLV